MRRYIPALIYLVVSILFGCASVPKYDNVNPNDPIFSMSEEDAENHFNESVKNDDCTIYIGGVIGMPLFEDNDIKKVNKANKYIEEGKAKVKNVSCFGPTEGIEKYNELMLEYLEKQDNQ